MNKEKMIDRLEVAKVIVSDVWDETHNKIDEVGDALCGIDEAINAIKEFEEEKTKK